MSWTKSGYNCSVIFSLFAKSSARSKGILAKSVWLSHYWIVRGLPDALQMHGTDLHDMPCFLAF